LAATYAMKNGEGSAVPKNDVDNGGGQRDMQRDDLIIKIDAPEEYVPFATWDPDSPAVNATPYSHLSRPLRVTLEEGDVLYLPALWYHKVSQSCNDDGICCAVNYWYDLDFSGSFWSTTNFVRSVGLMSMQEMEQEEKKQKTKD